MRIAPGPSGFRIYTASSAMSRSWEVLSRSCGAGAGGSPMNKQPGSYRVRAESTCNATKFNLAGNNVARLIRRARGRVSRRLAVCFQEETGCPAPQSRSTYHYSFIESLACFLTNCMPSSVWSSGNSCRHMSPTAIVISRREPHSSTWFTGHLLSSHNQDPNYLARPRSAS